MYNYKLDKLIANNKFTYYIKNFGNPGVFRDGSFNLILKEMPEGQGRFQMWPVWVNRGVRNAEKRPPHSPDNPSVMACRVVQC